MTEKEKMLKGMLYYADSDEQLKQERFSAKNLCYDYNFLRPHETEKQRELLEKLCGKVGENCTIVAPFYCDYGYNIEFGDNFFANHNLVILDGAAVKFGNNVLIGPDCGFHTAGHPMDAEQRNAGLEYACPITVGDNVWFGAGVQVMPGVTIGNNTVVAAGAVVTKDVPDNVLVGGVPARIIKKLNQE